MGNEKNEEEKKEEEKEKKNNNKFYYPRKEKNGEKYLEGDIEYKKIEMPKEEIKEEKDEDNEEEEESDDEVKKLKKEKMLKEYDFYLTKEIPKNKFVNQSKNLNLPMDFSNKAENKNQEKKYLCFVEAKTKKMKKIEIKPNNMNQLVRDEIYLFNQRQKQIKSIKPLSQKEHIKPYSYKVEFEMGQKGIKNKVIKRINNGNNEYVDIFPNGEGYKFKKDDIEEEKKEEKKDNENNNNALTKEQIQEIEKNDENNIVNIINKGLQENKLVEGEKKVDNANDF